MKKTAGFTIVEVLFVLAIAGIILLITFLALPQLQRNSRNNQRKQDVATVLGAVSHYELNNSGGFPDCGYGIKPACDSTGQPLEFLQSKLSYYTNASQIEIHAVSAGMAATNNPNTDLDKIYVFNYQKCDSQNQGQATLAGAGFNDVVALFAIESSSGSSGQCHEL